MYIRRIESQVLEAVAKARQERNVSPNVDEVVPHPGLDANPLDCGEKGKILNMRRGERVHLPGI